MGSRSYSTAIYNIKKEDAFNALKDHIKYGVFGNEVCPKTGKNHVQSYIQLHRPQRGTWLTHRIRLYLNNFQWTQRWQTCTEDDEYGHGYCGKDDKEPLICGKQTTQGQRSDIEHVKDMLMNDASDYDIIQTHPETFMKFSTGIAKMRNIILEHNTQFSRNVDVEVWIGVSGIGKTTTLLKHYQRSAFRLVQGTQPNLWWCGYKGQKTLIIDDFTGWIPDNVMLHITQGHMEELPIKYGSTYAQWTKVYIVSNYNTNDWYNGKGISNEFHNRIKANIKYFVTCDEVQKESRAFAPNLHTMVALPAALGSS